MTLHADYDPYARLAAMRPVPSIAVTSADFRDGDPLPRSAWSASKGGRDLSPALSWGEVPAGTRSLAVSCFDPDAPTGSGYWHWAVSDLPPDLRSLSAGAGDGEAASLPSQSLTLRNDSGRRRFVGAAPPAGTGVHRYYFVIDALDVERLEISEDATPAVLGFHRHFHSIGRAIIVGTAAGE